jgi:hypothetical protein
MTTPLSSPDTHGASQQQSSTTVGGWLAMLSPPPPPALAARLRRALASFVDEPVERVPEACLDAGEQMLDDLLGSGSTNRGSALDLLAVDALVTYAFQAAGDAPDRLEARAARAMARLAALPGERPD